MTNFLNIKRGGDKKMQHNKMQNNKLRHELKHFINLTDYFALRARLRAIANYDGHAGVDGKYKVRSLYFDNLEDQVLMEKLDGVNNREKLRIRYYNNDTSYIKLEKKSKSNGLCNKQLIVLSKEQCELIIHGDIHWLRESGEPLLLDLFIKMNYLQLRPKTVVDYQREAFVYRPGNVRITIDSDLKTGLFSKDIFNMSLPTISTVKPGTAILEVKYDEFLPDIISDIIQIPNRRQSAFSKYAASRIYS